MILATDVHYIDTTAIVAGVLFHQWDDTEPAQEFTLKCDDIADYESGRFYKRELPCVLALINHYELKPDHIIVDGYVYLDGYSKPGLGKHLFDALDRKVGVTGVAKNPFTGINRSYEVLRGESKKPLYVTSTGDLENAKICVTSMSGKFRFPTLLKRVDTLCRSVQPQ